MVYNQDIALQGNDLLIQGGDISIGYSDNQHISDTINAFPGWWKNNPQDGVGIFQYLNSGGQEQQIKRIMQIQLTNDGYAASPIVTTVNGQLTINPNISANL